MRIAGETANLVTYGEGEVVYLEQVESMHLVKMFTQPGMRAPLYCTASGKLFLAFGGDLTKSLIKEPLARHTANTLTTVPALEAQLKQIRRDGYAIDNEEMEEGVRCLAVPIYDRRGELCGALSISGPTTRMTPARVTMIVNQVREVAKELSRQLGYDAGAAGVAPALNGAHVN